MSDTVSVIIPVYNVENYLRECVDSVLTQTYTDLEIILTDDGATDSSGIICDEYAAYDNRVRVIHKQNGGLSSARNAGMEAATGEYIIFVDSDDSIESDCIEKLIGAICTRTEADFVFCDFFDPRRPDLSDDLKKKGSDPIIMDRKGYEEFLSNHLSREYVDAVVAWNKLFKRCFLEGLIFPEGRWHEDEFFVNSVLERTAICVFIPEKLYRYRVNDEGITGNKNLFDPRHLDVFDAYTERVNKSSAIGDHSFAEKTAVNGFEKLLVFFRDLDGSSSDTKQMRRLLHRKYASYYRSVIGALSLKRKLKYMAGLLNCRLLIRN